METSFNFIGGDLSLDFCNTADGDINSGEWDDWIADYPALLGWAQDAGLLPPERAAALHEQADIHPAEAAQVMEFAHALRLALFELFSATADERTPSENAVTTFNDYLQSALSHLRIMSSAPGQFGWRWADETDLAAPLWPIVWAASQLLTSERVGLVRQCSGKDCSWLFLDTSRNHSRRWCDMKGCGNRAKAHRHYQRSKV
jgi:predicted RNA-binding Zn ribbon-like protein